MAQPHRKPKAVLPIKKFDPSVAKPVREMELPAGKTIKDLIRENNVIYDARIPVSLLNRKGFSTDVTPCFGFESCGRTIEMVESAIAEAGCRTVRAFQGVAIFLIALRNGLANKRSYIVLGERIELEKREFFIRLSLSDEGRALMDLFPVEEFVDNPDVIAIAVRV